MPRDTKRTSIETVVVDASVGFKWFVPEGSEPFVPEAQQLMEDLFQGRLTVHVPWLFFYELHNIFLFSQSRMSAHATAEAIRQLHALPLEIHSPSADSGSNALKIAQRLHLSIYDATYLDLAENLVANLLTADQKLFQKARESKCIRLIDSPVS